MLRDPCLVHIAERVQKFDIRILIQRVMYRLRTALIATGHYGSERIGR